MKFSELNLPAEVAKGIDQVGFTDLTPVQEESIPLGLDGKDVAAQAQTGTGKTAAFLIILFTKLLQAKKRPSGKHPRALILAPTRELVVQICDEAERIGAFCDFTFQAVYGGVDYDKQRQALREGVDVVVATPGRLIDYAKQKVFSLGKVEVVVVDEADRMFDMGFIRDLRFILRRLPEFDQRQTMLFSATLTHRVMELAYEFMDLAEKVRIEPEQVTAEKVEQVLYHAGRKEKFPLLLGLLRKEQESGRVLVFANTKIEAERLTDRLKANEFQAELISGDIPQRKRMRILEQFKEGAVHFLVATDVASRGLHIDGVTHVINYDLPQDPEDYVHRIGRTARAGAVGKAISFADEDLVYHLPDIEEYIGRSIPSELPAEEDFVWDYKRSRPRPRPKGAGGKGGGLGAGQGRGPSKPKEGGTQPPRRRRGGRRKPGGGSKPEGSGQ